MSSRCNPQTTLGIFVTLAILGISGTTFGQTGDDEGASQQRFVNPALFLKGAQVQKSQLLQPTPASTKSTAVPVLSARLSRFWQDTQDIDSIISDQERADAAMKIGAPLMQQPLLDVSLKSQPGGGDMADRVPTDYALSLLGDYGAAVRGGDLRMGQHDYWQYQVACWQAPDFFHGPLYFEHAAAERYGHCVTRMPALYSAAHFFARVPLLPYQMGIKHPCERVYSLGYYRPGSCNPLCGERIPVNAKAIGLQALATVGVIAIFP